MVGLEGLMRVPEPDVIGQDKVDPVGGKTHNTLNIETKKYGKLGSLTFPEGTDFEFLPSIPADKDLKEFSGFWRKISRSEEGDPLYAVWQAFKDMPMNNIIVMGGTMRTKGKDNQIETNRVWVVVYEDSNGNTRIGVIVGPSIDRNTDKITDRENTESGKYVKVKVEKQVDSYPVTTPVGNTNFEGGVTYTPPGPQGSMYLNPDYRQLNIDTSSLEPPSIPR